jgi:UDP-N-acetyl-D-galactosamine dehydrogenase
MTLIKSLLNKEKSLSIIGLGYVGLPLAVSFSKSMNVIGYDINDERIKSYQHGIDRTLEVGDDVLQASSITFTSDLDDLSDASVYIIAIPTPIRDDKTPDLTYVIQASTMIAKVLKPQDLVIYESTVYPGVTEELCIPLLEKGSKLKCPQDFTVGYSPERINPQDKVHTLKNIVKIVSGIDKETTDAIASLYELIIEAGVHRTPNIKTAEAAKVVENAQRDINIAFMNECAMVFNKMNIDTLEVIEAMNTKWNALKFVPGLVGGHCIGVDPYYFIYEAERLGYHSQIIAAGRKINDGMAQFIAQQLIKVLILNEVPVKGSKIAILGCTFKENVNDIRNSKVFDIIPFLNEVGITPIVYDPFVNPKEVKKNSQFILVSKDQIKACDAILVAVAHDEFKSLSIAEINQFYKEGLNTKVLVDVKGCFNKELFEENNFSIIRL